MAHAVRHGLARGDLRRGAGRQVRDREAARRGARRAARASSVSRRARRRAAGGDRRLGRGRWRRSPRCRFAAPADAQAQAVEHAIEQGRRVAARGGDAVVLVDTLGGLPPHAARRALAAARNISDGGSLTVIADRTGAARRRDDGDRAGCRRHRAAALPGARPGALGHAASGAAGGRGRRRGDRAGARRVRLARTDRATLGR